MAYRNITMTIRLRKALIVYCSPAGSTGHVAALMKQKIESSQTPVTCVDLGEDPDVEFLIPQLVDAKDNICMYIGSPVYASHALAPVMTFIAHLPTARNGYAVPFVTWGGVTSGVALYEMGEALEKKGYAILGAAKVLARHSLMWAAANPLAEGRPDAADDALVEQLMKKVLQKLASGSPEKLPVSRLAYQKEPLHAEMQKKTFESAKAQLPLKEIHEDRCTRCGVCADVCPVEAVTLSLLPIFGSECICCYRCVRACPEKALTADLSPVFDRLRNMAVQYNERPPTQIFF